MYELKPKPVWKYLAPAYPPKLDVLAMPGLLAKHQPPGWLRHAEIAAAAGLFLAANASGCGKPKAPDLGPPKARVPAPNAPVVVAPIFRHGEGVASEGGAGPMPVYLSEEEAHRLIRDELSRSGVYLSTTGVNLATVELPLAQPGPAWAWDDASSCRVPATPTKVAPLKLDGLDPSRRIAVEFISNRDYWDIAGPWVVCRD